MSWISNTTGITERTLSHKLRSLFISRQEEIQPSPSLIETTDKIESPTTDLIYSYGCSSIAGLPVELILRIFHECAPGVRERLRLAHVCRRWLLISQNTPSLWTDIEIRVSHSWNPAHYDHFTALVGMQIAWCSNRLLDVTWTYNTKDQLRNKLFLWTAMHAPCERWRSLKLTVEGEPETNELEEVVARCTTFTNLESLRVGGHINSIIQGIQRTKSSKLHSLHLRDCYPRDADIYEHYMGILSQVSSFDLPVLELDAEPPLPRNITTVRAQQRRIHLFPYVLTYTVDRCFFETPATIDLRRLTTLTITLILDISKECKVLLPSLRHFTHQEVHLKQGARIEAPKLETLRVGGAGMSWVRGMDLTIAHPGYTLRPDKKLKLEMYIPIGSMLRLLWRCPDVEELTLAFSDSWTALEMVGRIANGNTLMQGPLATPDMCLKLRVLRLLFGWPISEVWKMREQAIQVVEKRRDTLGLVLEVFAMWKGEGSFVRLA